MDVRRKLPILFAATILAARKLHEIGDKPCPARECTIAEAVENTKRILQKIDERWPGQQQLEGVVAKCRDSLYEPGKRLGSWVK